MIERIEVEYGVGELRHGMFVTRLDRPWTETPFLLQGFLIESDEEIAVLSRYCKRVVVDVERSHKSAVAQHATRAANGQAHRGREVPVEEEVPRAKEALEILSKGVARLHQSALEGRPLDRREMIALVEPTVRSIKRNQDAFFWLQALQSGNAYRYSHAMNCCGLAAVLAVQLGMPEHVVLEYGIGGLVFDIGMIHLPNGLDEKRGHISDEEWELLQTHIQRGLEVYAAEGQHGIEDIPAQMIRHHHERRDGSGYPAGLSGQEIPLPGRVAGIIDTYDALLSDRPYRPAYGVDVALRRLHELRESFFQPELLEQFTQSLGVYPVGSLVEMNSGEVAIVMGQNPVRRLRPTIVLLTNADKTLRDGFKTVDLNIEDQTGSPLAALSIQRTLPKGAYGLNPSELYL